MVGYYNTLPFLHGLNEREEFNLILDRPSECIHYYDEHKVDIALVPVATLLERDDYKIVTDYCIGCIGEVRTVSLFTNGKIDRIRKIYLDQDSRTSQFLVKILCNEAWHIDPIFEERNVREIDGHSLADDEAVLMIGDKVFENEDGYHQHYDLGVEWERLTDLPFTFAVWIARPDVEDSVLHRLNEALGIGVNNIDQVLHMNKSLATKIDLEKYFTDYIDFHFDEAKKNAFKAFNSYHTTLKNKSLTALSK